MSLGASSRQTGSPVRCTDEEGVERRQPASHPHGDRRLPLLGRKRGNERVRRSATLVHDRVEGTSPVLVRVVHHDVDEDGHEKGEDRGAVTHLVPVDLAVPGRAAVDDLVAKDVEPVEDETKNADGVPLLEGAPEAPLRRPEPFLPGNCSPPCVRL